MEPESWTVHLLRQRWKPTKEELARSEKHQPLLIRIHRACSWIQSIEKLDAGAIDERLVFQWIAMNALYGRWDDTRREPLSDSKTLPLFMDHLSRFPTPRIRVLLITRAHRFDGNAYVRRSTI